MILRVRCNVQIRAAMGKTLRFKQEDIKLKVGSTLYGCSLIALIGDMSCSDPETMTRCHRHRFGANAHGCVVITA